MAILSELTSNDYKKVCVTGFDTDQIAITKALSRTSNLFLDIPINLVCESFVDISQNYRLENHQPLFAPQKFNIVIANPPYVRTQNLGASKSQHFANTFGLTGRVDLYHVFICGIAAVLHSGGIAGLIVSNRFMTTKSAADIRRIIQNIARLGFRRHSFI